MDTYLIEYDSKDVAGAIACGFDYVERRDEIVGLVMSRPYLMKQMVLASPEEITFSFVPEGIGMLRTAYLKMVPYVKDNEIRFINQDRTLCLRMFLKEPHHII